MSTKPLAIRHMKIYGYREAYCAWPSVSKLTTGELVVVFCRSEEHLGPTGSILATTSTDKGNNWSRPVSVLDSPIDDRESGLTLVGDGGEVMVHIWSTHHTESVYRSLDEFAYRPEVLERWIEYVNQPAYAEAKGLEGASTSVSADGGRTWSAPIPGADSIHGGVQLQDGSLLVASYRTSRPKIGIYSGSGDPFSWQKIHDFSPPHLTNSRFGEPHVALLPSGRLIMMIRSTAIPYDDSSSRNVLWMSYSDDQGHTWAEAYPTPLWGFPPHLLVLDDGRVLCTYGYRRFPFGQRACISVDGVTWRADDEIIIRDDAENGDLGYPASCEIEPGKILSVYYQSEAEGTPAEMNPPDPNRSKPGIWGSIWEIP